MHGRVCRLASFGAFVELAEGVEGLCHFSEIPGYTGRGGAEEPPIHVGDEYDFKIIKMSEAEKKIGLSLRAVADDEEKNAPGRLPAPGRGRHHDHRRSHESERPQPWNSACKSFKFTRYCDFSDQFQIARRMR